jgi:hypothetical protein
MAASSSWRKALVMAGNFRSFTSTDWVTGLVEIPKEAREVEVQGRS